MIRGPSLHPVKLISKSGIAYGTFRDNYLNLQTCVPVPDNANQKPNGKQIFENERAKQNI